jgi:hypothetical protein
MAYSSGVFDKVFFVRWQGAPTPADLATLAPKLEQAQERATSPLSYLTVVPPEAPVPSSDERQALELFAKKIRPRVEHAYVVLEGRRLQGEHPAQRRHRADLLEGARLHDDLQDRRRSAAPHRRAHRLRLRHARRRSARARPHPLTRNRRSSLVENLPTLKYRRSPPKSGGGGFQWTRPS